ncbi:reprolysin-like metallopeptidase [Actinoplanes sp. NPDC051470]|uniref:reprolysin-like metallopeptidase n=1 Tax=Actinoplanes sp. NPDC051470 TaxID=3157224 RepID=UPI0034263D3B
MLLDVSPASADPVPAFPCHFSGSGLELKWRDDTTSSSYSSVASNSAAAWNNSAAQVHLTKVSSGANMLLESPNFGPIINGIESDGVTYTVVNGGSYDPVCTDGLWRLSPHVAINRWYAEGQDDGSADSAAQRQSTLAHEIGHALGLAHGTAGSCPNVALMDPETLRRWNTCRINTPQDRDIQRANIIY